MNTLLSLAALASSVTLARAVSDVASGHAIVVNKCDFPVYMLVTPAANEGYDEINVGAVQPGGSYSQQWTGLTSASGTHDGWALKLALEAGAFYSGNLFQYEYTYQPTINATTVWLDLSSVDGTHNKFLTQGWNIHSTETCTQSLHQNQTYLYPTDDLAGMQPTCPSTSDVTVTLCEWSSSGSSVISAVGSVIGGVASVAGSLVGDLVGNPTTSSAPTTHAAPTTTAAPTTHAAPTTEAAPTTHAAPTTQAAPVAPAAPAASAGGHIHAEGGLVMEDNVVHNAAVPTTMATVASSSSLIYKTEGQTVTEIAVAWVTNTVFVDAPEATGEVKKRHVHHRAAHHA